MGSGIRIVAVVLGTAVVVSVLGGPVLAAPSEDAVTRTEPSEDAATPSEPPEVEPVATVELDALARARAVVAGRTSLSGGAEYARAQAEEGLVDVHRDRQAAADDLARVNLLLDHAREAHRESVEARHAAQEHFDDGVAMSYKLGAASSSALVMAALQSAADAHDLARAVRELDGVLGHSYQDLLEQIRAVEQARLRVESLRRLRTVAAEVLARADVALAPAEAAVETARVSARAAEVALLDAVAVALDAEDAAGDAIEAAEPPADAPPPVLARFTRELERATKRLATLGDPMGGGSDAGDEAGPTTDVRRRWVANRRRVVAAEAGLGAGATVVDSGMTCPVVDARFSNDFHYPRSHARRHLGTDVFGERGSEVVALADGVVTEIDAVDTFDGDSDLGGVSVSWRTEVGHFYASHLESLAEGLEVGDAVEAGQVLGTVGTSGNAAGTPPHLHVGWYVDGVAVNPYPTLAVVCGGA